MRRRDRKRLERRYTELVAQLTACWTYERFRHRLERGESFEASELPTTRLDAIHSELRSVQDGLDSESVEDSSSALDRVELELRRSAAELLAEDSRLGASDLRRFLTRVRRLDEAVLLGLLRFYVLAHRDESWEPELVDKIDFLLSRLGEEISGALLDRNRVRLRATVEALWASAASEAPGAPVLEAMRRQIRSTRQELEALADLDALEKSGLIARYRRLKHGLGRLVVEPSIAEEVVRTNAALSRTVQGLHAAEEWQIAADFARLREVEQESRPTEALSLEIDSLRRDMELYEEGRRWDDVRLETLHRLRRELRALRPQIGAAPSSEKRSGAGGQAEGAAGSASSSAAEPSGTDRRQPPRPPDPSELPPPAEISAEAETVVSGEIAEPTAPRVGSRRPAGADLSDLRWELVSQLFQGLERVVEASSSLDEAEEILQDPGLPYDLEQRELQAFLALREGAGEQGSVDRLIFTAAAVRHRLSGLRDALESGGDGSTLRAAQRTLRLAELLQAEVEEGIAEAEVDAAKARARTLRFLRVLLLRDYCSLWLEVRGAG